MTNLVYQEVFDLVVAAISLIMIIFCAGIIRFSDLQNTPFICKFYLFFSTIVFTGLMLFGILFSNKIRGNF